MINHQFSQIPKDDHTSEVESDEESSVLGLNSWVEDSTGPFLVTYKGQSNENKGQDGDDQRLENPVPSEQVKNDDRCIISMNEPLVIDSRNNLRASQMEGINLIVDLKPDELRKRIRNQSYI
ncbi:hypothetical protein RHMOL_Rhmol13G0279600 [Rhododendron molle]|uniref:Uncharacterized protein n=1 Tax=Rhododendron molle TaxID=49168 RepID=A0ACC0LBG3_RHOML|nr:hypothetical protein RHMOL_Rhmol13G0279600 [Rhododendron molle]